MPTIQIPDDDWLTRRRKRRRRINHRPRQLAALTAGLLAPLTAYWWLFVR